MSINAEVILQWKHLPAQEEGHHIFILMDYLRILLILFEHVMAWIKSCIRFYNYYMVIDLFL